MTTGIIIIVSALLILFIFNSCKGKKEENQTEKVKETNLAENPYFNLRDQAINVTADALNLKLENENEIYGVVMDWNMGDAIVTVVSFKTGDASVYMSTGQAMIGGYSHDSVINAAKGFVSEAKNYLNKATKTENTEPTKGNNVGFYFLTKSGKYYIEEDFKNIEDNSSEFLDFFEVGNKVITEYRLISER